MEQEVIDAFKSPSEESQTQIMKFLQTCKFFSHTHLQNNALFYIKRMVPHLSLQKYKFGDLIYDNESNASKGLFILVKGSWTVIKLNKVMGVMSWEKKINEIKQKIIKLKKDYIQDQFKGEQDYGGDLRDLCLTHHLDKPNTKQIYFASSQECYLLNLDNLNFLQIFDPLFYQYKFLSVTLEKIFTRVKPNFIKYRIAPQFEERIFNDNATIISQKENNFKIMIIREGCVQITKKSSDQETDIEILRLHPGDIFGHENINLEQETPNNISQYSFKAMQSAWVYCCTWNKLKEIVKNDCFSLFIACGKAQNLMYHDIYQLHEQTLMICNSKKKSDISLRKIASNSMLQQSFNSIFDQRIIVSQEKQDNQSHINTQNYFLGDLKSGRFQENVEKKKKMRMISKTSATLDDIEFQCIQSPVSVQQSYKEIRFDGKNSQTTSSMTRLATNQSQATLSINSQQPYLNETVNYRNTKSQKFLPRELFIGDFDQIPRERTINTMTDVSSSYSRPKNVSDFSFNQNTSIVGKFRIRELLKKNQIFKFQDNFQAALFQTIEGAYFKETRVRKLKNIRFKPREEETNTEQNQAAATDPSSGEIQAEKLSQRHVLSDQKLKRAIVIEKPDPIFTRSNMSHHTIYGTIDQKKQPKVFTIQSFK